MVTAGRKRLYLCFLMGPLSVMYRAFLSPLVTYASLGWFPFLNVTNITKLELLHRAASRAITSCLSSSPLPLLLSEASLPLLRVTLTPFVLSSYERAYRLPNSFSILGLARLEVKPRFCRSSWRALASTQRLILSSREALCLPSPTSLEPAFLHCGVHPFFSMHPALIPPLSRRGEALVHLDTLPPHDLVIWTDGSVPFPFGKGSSGVLANCFRCGTEVTLSFPASPI